jgi:hypothetical protein
MGRCSAVGRRTVCEREIWNVLLCVPSLIEEMRLQLLLAAVSPQPALRALLLQWARLGVWSSSETNSRNVCLIGHRRVLG